MSSSEVDVEVENKDLQLKYLEFVRILAANGIVMVSNIYDNAKQNSGPLKTTVETVENTVKAVFNPVYEKFKYLPRDLIVFLDNKVDEATYKFHERAPPAAKNVACKVQSVVKRASQVARDLAEEAKVGGPLAAITRAGSLSKQMAVNQLAVLWFKANQVPALHGASEMAAPAVAVWSEKYNSLVKDMSMKGYSFFDYVPLVPVEEMAQAYKEVEAAACKENHSGSSSESASDNE